MQSVSSVQPLSCVQLSATPWTAAYQASLSITNSQSMLKFMSSSRWYHPTISSSVIPFSSYLQSLPASLFQRASSSHQMANIIIFTLAQPLHSFWNYFSTLLQKYIGHLLTWRVHLSVSYFLDSLQNSNSELRIQIQIDQIHHRDNLQPNVALDLGFFIPWTLVKYILSGWHIF